MFVLELVIIFISSFVTVFLIGFQHYCLTSRSYLKAFVVSCCISLCMVVGFKVIPAAGVIQIVFYVLGSGLGIVSSIFVENWKINRKSTENV